MDKPILYFDMDGVLVDFQSGIDALDISDQEREHRRQTRTFDEAPGIFALMRPMPGAIDAVRRLAEHYDLHILSTAPWKNPSAWSDKLLWIKRYFDNMLPATKDNPDGNPFYKKITITHCKNLATGGILIEDNLAKNGSNRFHGDKIWLRIPGNQAAKCDPLLQRRVAQAENWAQVLALLLPADELK